MADKWQEIQEEMKLLKNEIKQVLLDIKERLDTPGAISTMPTVQVAPVKPAPALEESAPSEQKAPPPKVEPIGSIVSPGASENGNGHNNGKSAQVLPAASSGPTAQIAKDCNRDGRSKTVPDMAPSAPGNGSGVDQPAGGVPPFTGKPAADLLTVSMLSQWLANGVRKVGRPRMEVLLDIYGQLGGLSAPLKDALMKLLNTDEGDGQSMREGISLLVEVDNLVRRSLTDRSEAAILSLFLTTDGNVPAVVHSNGNGNSKGNGNGGLP